MTGFLLLVLAEAADPIPAVGYGALGSLFIAAVFGYIWFKPAVERILKDKDAELARQAEDKDRVTKQRDDLLALLTSEVMPALASNTEANHALKPVLEEVVRILSVVDDRTRPPAPRKRA